MSTGLVGYVMLYREFDVFAEVADDRRQQPLVQTLDLDTPCVGGFFAWKTCGRWAGGTPPYSGPTEPGKEKSFGWTNCSSS
jgi:hypothetical protein